MKAWHFCDGWKLRDGTPLEVGRTYTHDGPLEMCRRGYHASERIIDALRYALRYAPGAILCRVELGGEILRDTYKCVAERRKVLWAVDAERLLHYAACDFATMVLERFVGNVDPRSWAAIDAKLGWLEGCVSAEDLAAASAAARDAASAVASAVARDAVRAAARDAASTAARDAAWDAAWAAARDAAWDKMDAHLLAMVEAEREDGGEK